MSEICTISRRVTFAASYRYWLPELSEAENWQRFGIAARAPGSTFTLWVQVRGPVDDHGMVANLSTTIKRTLQREVLQPLHGAYLNDVWPEFANTLPSSEFVAIALWQRLAPCWAAQQIALSHIQLSPDASLVVDYRGQDMEADLTIHTHFSAAHRLSLPSLTLQQNSEIYGKCARPSGHGHNYKLWVTVRGPIHPRTGMVIELNQLRELVDQEIIDHLDHTFLNQDIPAFEAIVPTAENIAIYIRDRLLQPIQELGVQLVKIRLDETDNNSCEVYVDSSMNCADPSPSMSAAIATQPAQPCR
ncbi:MAG: 6-pyruvoyl tetrahydropterin synthase [Oscillatoriales cyanobacterium]|nr:MAG: 6-pyruvoyl tetrahydropterin synthase [Oscillatoriales cyanobacterium]